MSFSTSSLNTLSIKNKAKKLSKPANTGVATPVNLMALTNTLVLMNNDVIVGEKKNLDKGVITIKTDSSDSLYYLVSARKLCKIRNVSFGDILIFLNSLMQRHHFVSKKLKSHPKSIIS